MKRVFTSMDPLLAEQVRSVLENAGIECHLAHRDLRSLAGAIPFPECSPEVWVVEESQAAAAERLIGELTAPRLPGDAGWRCDLCGEMLGSRFTSCWKCAGAAELRADRSRAHQAAGRPHARHPRALSWMALVLMAIVALIMLGRAR